MTIYKLQHTLCGEVRVLTLPEILSEINSDRGPDWQDYDETDWREGLAEFTDLKVLGVEG